MNQRLNKLKEYGADINGAMERFIYHEALYLSFLDSLEKTLKISDYEMTFHFDHTLKRVSRNIKLAPFPKAVENLAEALRAKDYQDVQALYQEVTTHHTTLNQL